MIDIQYFSFFQTIDAKNIEEYESIDVLAIQ